MASHCYLIYQYCKLASSKLSPTGASHHLPGQTYPHSLLSYCCSTMPPIRDLLQQRKVSELRTFISDAGLENPPGRTKAPLVDILLLHPHAIPNGLCLAADPPVVLADRPLTLAPPAAAAPSVSAEAIAHTVHDSIMRAMAPYLEAIAELQAKSNERMDVDGEQPPTLIPTEPLVPAAAPSTPLPASATLPDARLAFDHIPSSTLESITENRFDVKDLWKLDPMRAAEQSLPARGTFLAQLEQEMTDTEEHRRSRARTRYTDIGQILRPWLVYAQLRDLLAPQSRIGWHLINHARELLRLHAEYPLRWDAFLNYFFIITARRLNLAASLDPAEWNRPDMALVLSQFLAPQAPSAQAPSSARPNAGPSSASRNWSISSIGTGARAYPCDKWNDAKPCATEPCPFLHVCKNCRKIGHTRMRCKETAPVGK